MKQQKHSGVGDNYNIKGNAYFENSNQKLPSMLAEIVNLISKRFKEKTNSEPNRFKKPPTVDEKIDHNRIVSYKEIIHEFTLLNGILFRLYDTLESEGTPQKNNILRYIHTKYLEYRGHLMKEHQLSAMEVARQFSDEILKYFFDSLKQEVYESSNIDSEIELIDTAIRIIVVDAFINCKILESPNNVS